MTILVNEEKETGKCIVTLNENGDIYYEYTDENGNSVTKTDAENIVGVTKFSKEEQVAATKYKSAFFGTDLHIVERMGMLIGEGDGITEEYIKKIEEQHPENITYLDKNSQGKQQIISNNLKFTLTKIETDTEIFIENIQ